MQLVIETKKERISKVHQLSRLLAEAVDLEGVVLILRSFLAVNPTLFEARYLLRRLQIELYNRGSHSLMGHSLAKLKIPLLLTRTKELLEREPYKALEIAEDILAGDPFDETGNQLIVTIAKKQQNFRLMVLAYETLCVKHPNNMTYLYELGEAYLLDQRYTEAREVFNQILQVVPDHESAAQGLAKIAEMSGLAARWHLNETVHFKPDVAEHRAPLFNTKEFAVEAAPAPSGPLPLDGAITADPVAEQGALVARLGSAYEAVENQALHNLSKFQEWQSGIEEREGERLRHYEHQIALAPTDPEINFRLGVINMERFHLEQARQQLEVAAGSKNLEFAAYALLALCLLHESIVHRPAEGPSRADFAWFV